MTAPAIVWFRQDLRLADQAALAAAAAEGPVLAVYILDDVSPGRWKMGGAQRWWLHHSLAGLARDFEARGLRLVLRRGESAVELRRVAEEAGSRRVHALHHYEPWWRDAEQRVGERLDLALHPGNQLAPPGSIASGGGTPYRIYTPFWRALEARMPPPEPLPVPELQAPEGMPPSDRLEDWGLLPTKPDWATGFADWSPGEASAIERVRHFADLAEAYGEARDLPSQEGTSRLSPHLHFGEISPATIWHEVPGAAGAKFRKELAWRDFAQNVMLSDPEVGERPQRAQMERFPWREGKEADSDFAAWTRGRTGYPIVDAGMRQLWATGWMHNRVRMIAASFLVKHLLIDWRRGADWFWDTLVDADHASNALNWQWIAGSGADSSPFGRIMAPLSQSVKFGAGDYIRRWVPQLAHLNDTDIHDPHAAGAAPSSYPPKLIGHREARERALAALASLR